MVEAPDQLPPPRQRADFYGHEAAEDTLLAAAAGRLPHAWLLAGPRGVGKATLAYRFARFVLAGGVREQGEGGADLLGGGAPAGSLQMDPQSPTFRRVASGAHAGLMVVERSLDERTKRRRGEIVVDQIRDLGRFFTLTSGEGGWRVAIVDSADEMNANAANALLKVLEEPPPRSLLLLVAHAPGRLLPTIRSRCRTLRLPPLSAETVGQILARDAPELSAEDAAALGELAEGSPGRALVMSGAQGLNLYRELLSLAGQLPRLDQRKLHALADRLARRDQEAQFRMWGEMLPLSLARGVRALSQGEDARVRPAMPEEAAFWRHLSASGSLDRWIDLWEKISRLVAQADWANLDRKQIVLSAYFALEAAESGG